MNPYYDPGKPHHPRKVSRTSTPGSRRKAWRTCCGWRWDASRRGLPPPPQAPIPRLAPDLDFLHRNARAAAQMQPAVTWHPGGPPLFIVPLGLKPWLAGRGIRNAVELDWWQSHMLQGPSGDVEVMLVPAQHWSARGLTDRMTTLWGGFAVFAQDCHLFYAGDTGYSRDFTDMRTRFAQRQKPEQGGGFDIAVLPIGSYEPRWFMATQHVNVQEAIKIHRDLRAKQLLGVHWGTFELTDEALDEPPRVLAAERRAQGLPDDEFFVMVIGETRVLRPR